MKSIVAIAVVFVALATPVSATDLRAPESLEAAVPVGDIHGIEVAIAQPEAVTVVSAYARRSQEEVSTSDSQPPLRIRLERSPGVITTTREFAWKTHVSLRWRMANDDGAYKRFYASKLYNDTASARAALTCAVQAYADTGRPVLPEQTELDDSGTRPSCADVESAPVVLRDPAPIPRHR